MGKRKSFGFGEFLVIAALAIFSAFGGYIIIGGLVIALLILLYIKLSD